MKTFFFFVTLFLSIPAFADYFFCRLDYGPNLSRTVEADYRVLEAEVSAGVFKCQGKITGRETSVTINSMVTGESATASEDHSLASVELWSPRQEEGGFELGTCTCGMH